MLDVAFELGVGIMLKKKRSLSFVSTCVDCSFRVDETQILNRVDSYKYWTERIGKKLYVVRSIKGKQGVHQDVGCSFETKKTPAKWQPVPMPSFWEFV